MGIFQQTASLGSMFGRQKKDKMTSKENEDEQSLVSLSRTKKTARKVPRKKKIATKFRRLQEEYEERRGTPEYEPPKGFEFPEEDTNYGPNGRATGVEPPVNDIDLSKAACDTVSTLEESVDDVIQKSEEKKKEKSRPLLSAGKKHMREFKDSSNVWILDFQDKPFEPLVGPEKEPVQKAPKVVKKESPKVEPKFYPLSDGPSSDVSATPFEMPAFGKPSSRQDRGNIQFTNSEDLDSQPSDENVEKVSSIGSNDFHQFIVKKLPGPSANNRNKPLSKHDSSMKKAAESIAAKLSSPVPQKSKSRMMPKSSNAKRPRNVLDEAKSPKRPVPSTTAKILNVEETQSLHSKSIDLSDPSASSGSQKAVVLLSSLDSSLGLDQLAEDAEDDFKENEEDIGAPMEDTRTPFDIGSFSYPSDPKTWHHSSSSSKKGAKHNGNENPKEVKQDLIDIIRIASLRSEDEASRKPDPSPTNSTMIEVAPKKVEEKPRPKKKKRQQDDTRDIPYSKSSTSAFSGLASSNPSAVPSNAILGSMLFRHAHSEGSDSIGYDIGSIPPHVGVEAMEIETVSSVSVCEEAGSFYHDNFERWNNRAHQAINKLYNTYHNASTKMLRNNPNFNGGSGFYEA